MRFGLGVQSEWTAPSCHELDNLIDKAQGGAVQPVCALRGKA